MLVKFGNKDLEMGGRYLTELRESNDIFEDTHALQSRLQEDGYLLIRGFHDREKVGASRMEFLQKLHEKGALTPNTPLEDGIIGAGGAAFPNMSQENYPCFYEVVNSSKIMSFCDRLLGGDTITYDFKWPRAVGHGENTGAHYDIVYMGRGTKKVYTVWTPFGDLPLEMGTLALLLGSQHFEKIKQTYGQMDVDRDNIAKGWFSEDPIEIVDQYGGQWATTEFKMGDIIIFGMFIMHASLNNMTNRYRLSADTRYQLDSEPKDERWVGSKPKGHYAWGKGEAISIDEARKKWGV